MKKTYSLEDDFDSLDFHLYGIRTYSIAEYLFIFQLNSYFPLQLERLEDFNLIRQGHSFLFSQYHYYNPITTMELTLYTNISHPIRVETQPNTLFEENEIQDFLLKKYKNFQFILKTNQPLTEDFLVHLSANSNIQLITEIDTQHTAEINSWIA